ncbi:hypothetical protein QUA24_26180 [Microcoleus sp. Pol12B5]
MADWRSSIQTMALLYPASTICLWVELAPATVRWAEKTATVDRINSIYHGNTLEMQTAELVVNRELMM